MRCYDVVKHCPYYDKYDFDECLCPYWREYVNEDYPCSKYPPYTDVALLGKSKSESEEEETKELPFLCI